LPFKNAAVPTASSTHQGISGNVETDGQGNSTVYLQKGTLDDVLKAIDFATGVRVATLGVSGATGAIYGVRMLEILAKMPDTRVLILTSVIDDNLVYEAMSSGAHGYLLKEINAQAMLQAIVDVAAGDVTGATSRAEIVAIDSAGSLVHVIDAATMAPVAGSPFSTVSTPNSCVLVDVNADSKLDIAVAGAGGVKVNLSPLFSLDTVALSSAAASSIVTGNLNGQSKPDFAWLSASNDLVVAYGYNVGAAPDRVLSGNCLLQGDSLVTAHLSPIGAGGASPGPHT